MTNRHMRDQDLDMRSTVKDRAGRLHDNNPRHLRKKVDTDLHGSVLALLRWYDLCTSTTWGVLRSHDVVSGSNACK